MQNNQILKLYDLKYWVEAHLHAQLNNRIQDTKINNNCEEVKVHAAVSKMADLLAVTHVSCSRSFNPFLLPNIPLLPHINNGKLYYILVEQKYSGVNQPLCWQWYMGHV